MPPSTDQLPPEVRDALQRGSLIEAIKLLRKATGLGLAEAKSLIDRHPDANAEPKVNVASALALPEVVEALRAGNKIEAIRLVRLHTGIGLKDAKDAVDAAPIQIAIAASGKLSPGEVPRSNGFGWWVAIAALIALAAYYFR